MFVTAAHLRAARAYLGLSQAEVALEADISLPTLKRLESEASGPQRANVSNVEAVTKVYTNRGIQFLLDDRDGVSGIQTRDGCGVA